MESELARPSQIQKTPPSVCKIKRARNLPLIPKYLAATSETIPPKGRARRLATPKVAAITPAV